MATWLRSAELPCGSIRCFQQLLFQVLKKKQNHVSGHQLSECMQYGRTTTLDRQLPPSLGRPAFHLDFCKVSKVYAGVAYRIQDQEKQTDHCWHLWDSNSTKLFACHGCRHAYRGEKLSCAEVVAIPKALQLPTPTRKTSF